MDRICLVHMDQSEDHLRLLSRFDITSYENQSWIPKPDDTESYKKLLRDSGLITGTDAIVYPVVGRADSDVTDLPSLFQSLLTNVQRLLPDAAPQIDYLLINITQFVICRTVADEILTGLNSYRRKIDNAILGIPIFLVREHVWFKGSRKLSQIVSTSQTISCVYVIDINGFLLRCMRIHDAEKGKANEDVKEIKERVFAQILRFQSEGDFRKALIYQTNINIGHFRLPHSHIRTHYDLKDFVSRDNVFEHLNSKFLTVIKKYNNVTIIGTGLEEWAMTVLGNRLKAFNSSIREFSPYFGRIVTNEDILRWVEKSDCLVVLTDIVNTGTTVNGLIKRIFDVAAEARKDTGRIPPDIKVFCNIRMQNTEPSLYEGVTLYHAVALNRVFYDKDEDKCLLCQLKQPGKDIDNEKLFADVIQDHLTPLDYWEMVEDCKALRRERNKRNLIHRVETSLILQRYSIWLQRLIEHNFVQFPALKPKCILTVDESGREFAAIVSRAAGGKVQMIALEKNTDRSIKVEPAQSAFLYSLKGMRALIVDDGINTGKTINELIDVCNGFGIKPQGVLVFDNRLDDAEIRAIERKMPDDSKVLALYSWPTGHLIA